MDGEANIVCECCKNLDPRETPWAGTWATGPVFEDVPTKVRGVADLLAAQEAGCSICGFLLHVVQHFGRYMYDFVRESDINVHVLAPHNRPLEVRIQPRPGWGRLADIINVQISRTRGNCIPELPNLGGSLILAKNAGDPKCIRFIEACLQQCAKHHSAHPVLARSLPLRVVDVGPNDRSVCLREPVDELDQYAALSYRWGSGTQLLMLTSQTLVNYKDCIPWDQLPKTLQHAISIVRGLGLRYIWIDCLCIMQDSDEDWEIESSKMATYYKDALLTIAASASACADSGTFLDRSAVSIPQTIIFTSSDGTEYPTVAQKRPIRSWPSPVHELGPLSERAWTLQEHALSTRIVHYLESEIIWECSQSMTSEDGHPINDNMYSLVQQLTDESFSVDKAWRFLVRAYSGRAMTNLSDKLPAISGIASHFGSKAGYQYIAGLWKETLAVDLAWTRVPHWEHSKTPADKECMQLIRNIEEQDGLLLDHPMERVEDWSEYIEFGSTRPGKPRSRFTSILDRMRPRQLHRTLSVKPQKTRRKIYPITFGPHLPMVLQSKQPIAPAPAPILSEAPSWSWASIHGSVSFPMESFHDSAVIKAYCKIERVDYKNMGTNLFGKIDSGTIEITGPLQEAKLCLGEGQFDYHIAAQIDLVKALEEDSRLRQDEPPRISQMISINALGQGLVFVPDSPLQFVSSYSSDKLEGTFKRTSFSRYIECLWHGAVWCLWCFTAERSGHGGQLQGQANRTFGIVLGKRKPSSKSYIRIGSVCMPQTEIPDGTPITTVSIE